MSKEAKLQEVQSSPKKFKVESPDLFCDSNNRITHLCIQQNCPHFSLICNIEECKTCEVHLHCLTTRFKSVTGKLINLSQRQSSFIDKIRAIEDKFIDSIHEKAVQLSNTYEIPLEDNQAEIFNQIYRFKNIKCLNGKKASLFLKEIQRFNDMFHAKSDLMIEKYEKELNSLAINLFSFRQKFFENIGKQDQQYDVLIKEICSAINEKDQSRRQDKKGNIKEQKSLHLLKELKKDQLEFLNEGLSYPKGYKFLFRASEHQFKAKAFHQKCDNIHSTLTIVRTEFGKTLAGYTEHCWNSVKNYWVKDDGQDNQNYKNRTLLFSLDNKKKLLPTQPYSLIYCYRMYGPTFGNGFDLCLTDQCNVYSDSYANIPSTFNVPSKHPYKPRDPKNYELFTGSKYGNEFKVLQYEVYEVIHE